MPGFALIWLAQIARRMCWQLKEREALQPQVQFSSFEEGEVEVANGVEAPDVSAAASERKTLVREAAERLPAAWRDGISNQINVS